MAYNYGMHNKTPQQQAVVRQRENADKLRKTESSKIIHKVGTKTGDFELVVFSKGATPILELRISGTAIANQPCGLDRDNIYDWLSEIGRQYIKETQKFEIVLITSNDVVDGNLITDWKELKRVDL